MKSAPFGVSCTTGPSAVRCVSSAWSATVAVAGRAGDRQQLHLGDAVVAGCSGRRLAVVWMPVSRLAIFGAASRRRLCQAWPRGGGPGLAGTGAPSALPLSSPLGFTTREQRHDRRRHAVSALVHQLPVVLARPARRPPAPPASCRPAAIASANCRLAASGSSALAGGGTARRGVGGCASSLPVAPGLPRKGSGRSPQEASSKNGEAERQSCARQITTSVRHRVR